MRGILYLVMLLFSNAFFANASSVSNVRLVGYMNYATSVVQKTMNRVEKNHWCNLKMEDLKINMSESVLGVSMSGDVEFTNGFLVSLRKIDIIRSTVQQVWLPARGNTTTVEIRATVRLLDFVVGFDVTAKMKDNNYRTTGVMRYPEIRFAFVITKHLFTDAITVTISSSLQSTTNRMEFSPENDVTKVVSVLFDWNMTADSFRRWATNVLAPITLDIVHNEIEFPRICYNCPVRPE